MPTPRKQTLPPSDNPSIDVSKRLIHLRKTRGLTQNQLAEAIGISRNLLSNYEMGRTHLTDQSIILLAKALNISSDELLGLQTTTQTSDLPPISLRLMKRVAEIEKLPEPKKKAILKTLDDLIRANS